MSQWVVVVVLRINLGSLMVRLDGLMVIIGIGIGGGETMSSLNRKQEILARGHSQVHHGRISISTSVDARLVRKSVRVVEEIVSLFIVVDTERFVQ